MNSPIALFAKIGSAAILKNLAVSESSDDAMFLHFFVSSQLMGAQWLSGRVFEPRLWADAGSNLTGVTVLCP